MYTIGDFLIRTKNAYLARKREFSVPYSKVGHDIANVLVKEGFLKSVKKTSEGNKKSLKIELNYLEGMPVLQDIKLISSPSVHKYVTRTQLNRLNNELGVFLLSTNKGVLIDKEAKKQKLGGELLAQIY